MEPLANQIRPRSLEEFVGQSHLVGPDKPLRLAIEQGHIFSFVLWGTPGTGKTTLARIYANAINAEFYELSAVSAGKDDIRKIVKTPSIDDRPRVLFLDEIHRFNKAQQDFLLPYVESGELVLIGATTENPSFEVIPALLSRMRVFVLEELSPENMAAIIDRTGFDLDIVSKDWLIEMANGDARQAITMIENTSHLYDKITLETLKETLQSKFLRYDKKGEEHYNVISAFIKSMRASRPGRGDVLSRPDDRIRRRPEIYRPPNGDLRVRRHRPRPADGFGRRKCRFPGRRTMIGMPECALNLAHGVAYLANAAKDRSTTKRLVPLWRTQKKFGNLPVPMKIRNAPTKLMKNLGYGKDEGNDPEGDLLPEKLRGRKYFGN